MAVTLKHTWRCKWWIRIRVEGQVWAAAGAYAAV